MRRTNRLLAIATAVVTLGTLLPLTSSSPAQAQTPAAGTAPAATPSPKAARASYKGRLGDLSKRLEGIQSRLKLAGERIQRLRNYMVKNVNPEARLILRFDDRMGNTFVPLAVIVEYDGAEVASWTKAQRNLKAGGSYVVFNRHVPLGAHTLRVKASYKGAGGMPYMKDFAYKLNRTHRFKAKGGEITTLIAYGYQRGDATYDPSQRPWIGFDMTSVEYSQVNLRKLAPEAFKKSMGKKKGKGKKKAAPAKKPKIR